MPREMQGEARPHNHEESIAAARDAMPGVQALVQMCQILSAMADPTRLKIVLALRDGRELCVYDLCTVLSMTQSAVSHQLRVLRDVRCVRSRRSGKSIFYSLDDDHVDGILSVALSHVSHLE